MVAVGDDELPKLDALFERGKRNGVPGMRLLSADEMRRREPLINPQVSGALFAETGAMCDPFGVTLAAAENAVMNGVTILRDTAFEDFIMDGKRIIGVRTNRGDFCLPLGGQCRRLVFRRGHAQGRCAPGIQDHPAQR